MEVAVIKVGVGNTASVLFALERLGARGVLIDEPEKLSEAERVIVPGVGAAAPAMHALRAKGLDRVLQAFRRPLLGICLGQQLLFERSEEGDARCLGLIPGAVQVLTARSDLPVPHMGWTSIEVDQKHPLLAGIEDGAYFYFVHSFACPITAETVARAEYGRPFAAVTAKANVLGCQFHPERSGAAGARLLRNFLSLPC